MLLRLCVLVAVLIVLSAPVVVSAWFLQQQKQHHRWTQPKRTQSTRAAISATTQPASSSRHSRSSSPSSSRLYMAIDYNDPVVAEEFNKVQPMSYENVEEELMAQGIPVPPTMNEMEVKLMLVEMRLRVAGKVGGQGDVNKQPETFTSKLEEALWTKPAFKEFYDYLNSKGDPNAINVVAEYVTDPELAAKRYGKDYETLMRKAEIALNAPPPVKSPTLSFAGFPANMGEDACKMTLESIGTVVEFECEADEDFPILRGKVTFEDVEDAKKAVEQYNGMDMGMGTALEMVSV